MAQTRHDIPQEFLDAADRFVQLANEINDEYSRDFVASVMMYATARYNAFVWLTREGEPQQTQEQAAAYYAGQYDKMLRDNLGELAPVYEGAAGASAPLKPN